MSSRRRTFGRILLVAILVVIALLLLELGRLLPGTWPGGGGDSGSRSYPTRTKPDPAHLVPSVTPPPTPPRPLERGMLRVVVRRADGTPVDGGSVVVGAAGSPSAGIVKGEAHVRTGGGVPDDWSLVLPGGARIGHGRPPTSGDGEFVAVLPRRWPDPTPPSDGAGGGEGLRLRVEDQDGHPIAGATVASTGKGGERQDVTDADGGATVSVPDGVRRYCVTATGFGEACRYARLAPGAPLLIRLSKTRLRQTTFVDPVTDESLVARSLTLIDRRGTAKRLERESGSFDRFEIRMSDDEAAEAMLDIDVAGRPPVRVPVTSIGGSTPVPAGVTRTVRAVDEKGEPIAGAAVTARFPSAASLESASAGWLKVTATTDAQGRAVLSLPRDRDSDLVVDSGRFAAIGLRLKADTKPDAAPIDVRLATGVDCVVTVNDEKGSPVAGADVFVLAAADRSTARRRATTDPAGRATIRGVAPGRVEVLVHRAGLRWQAEETTAAAGSRGVVVVLRPGRRLTLVVEDAAGVPLPRVAVRSVQSAGSRPSPDDASDPDAVLPWETDESGVLVVDDLPDREIDLYLSKPGFDEEVVARVRPGPATIFATLVPTAKAGAK